MGSPLPQHEVITVGTIFSTIDSSSKDEINVQLSIRFLEHFSEQLYSSPQKAFEELVSNSWDANAQIVDIHMSDNLDDPNAVMYVFDNGISMNLEGLTQLWKIASSPKRGLEEQHGRRLIGKFGIGKLATYVLANQLTYICKASDGKIRTVTMDYGALQGNADDQLLSEIKLDVYEMDEERLSVILDELEDGEKIYDLISGGEKNLDIPQIEDDEFMSDGDGSDNIEIKINTWTLAILSKLKPVGRRMKRGIFKQMLRAALPLGNEMVIRLNDEILEPSKLDALVKREWIIGKDIEFDSIKADINGDTKEYQITSKDEHHIEIESVGKITGKFKIYKSKISGGKSDNLGASNGFYVNVLGRLVNQDDPSFGEKNLSHSSWARFRMTVRADGLNDCLTTNREQFKDREEIRVFKAFVRKCFNIARSFYDSDGEVTLVDSGDILVKSMGALSLAPLKGVVEDALSGEASPSELIDMSGIEDTAEFLSAWKDQTGEKIKNALDKVEFSQGEKNGPMAKFNILNHSIEINKNHPFVEEHNRTKAEKELLRTIAMINLLSDMYAVEMAGIDISQLEKIQNYRDKMMRYRALERRKSGMYIATLLLDYQDNSKGYEPFEKVVSEALIYLGFEVQELGASGKPEGVATAYGRPAPDNQTYLYKFTYDAKASKKDRVQVGNLNISGLEDHKKTYEADYAMVIAPGFQSGAVVSRCTEAGVTPISAKDLGVLLKYSAEYGALDLNILKEVFSLFDPDQVSQWVADLDERLKSTRKLTLDAFFEALKKVQNISFGNIQTSAISVYCGMNGLMVSDSDVFDLVNGLKILVPDLVGIDKGNNIVLGTSAEKLASAVRRQLDKLQV